MKKLLQIMAVMALLFTPAMAYAEEGGHGHAGDNPPQHQMQGEHGKSQHHDKAKGHMMHEQKCDPEKHDGECPMHDEMHGDKAEKHGHDGDHDKASHHEKHGEDYHKEQDDAKDSHKDDGHGH